MSRPRQENQMETTQEIDLGDLFLYLWSKNVKLLLELAIGAGAGDAITYFLITPTYRASSYLYMVAASSGTVVDLSDLNIGTNVSSDYEQLLIRRPVLDNVAANLSDEILVMDDLPNETESEGKNEYLEERAVSSGDVPNSLQVATVTDLADYISISTVGDSRVLQITVTTPSPVISRDIANEVAEQAVDYIPQIMNVTAPTIAEYAVTPKGKAAPSMRRNMAVGGILGFLLMAAIYTIRHLMDDTVKDAEEFESLFGMVPLAVIPEGEITTGDSDQTDGQRRRLHQTRK